MVLELRGVQAGYGERSVFQGLDADIPEGRVTVILGPGGSGKSTLLRVLAGDPGEGLWFRGRLPESRGWRLPQRYRTTARPNGSGSKQLGEQLDARVLSLLQASEEVLLLDEPDTALDPDQLPILVHHIRLLCERGKTLIVVTHNLEFARRIADYGLLLIDGEKLDEGEWERLTTEPACTRVRDFLTWGG